MNIFKVHLSLKENENKIEIFSHVAEINKSKYKIIYNNKMYPLQREYKLPDKIKKQLKIKLISYTLSNILDKRNFKKSYIFEFHESKKYKKRMNKYNEYLKYLEAPFRDISKIVYKIEPKEEKLKIFGSNFVEHNRNKCIVIYKNKKFTLNEYFFIPNEFTKENTIELILIELEDISDKSYMFHECDKLEEFISLKDIPKEKEEYSQIYLNSEETKKLRELYPIYEESEINDNNYSSSANNSLISFWIDKLKMYNNIVSDMSFMFYKCSSLKYLPNISHWNTDNLTNISFLFYGCSSLLTIPDICKWNTYNITNISCLFYGCISLISLPDLSKWNTSKIIYMYHIFDGCSLLSLLPNISKWNTLNAKYMNSIFSGCSSLKTIPDISKWNTNNTKDMNGMFKGCL